MKTKLVYIASPYTAVFDTLNAKSNMNKYEEAYSIAKHIAHRGIRKIRQRNGSKDFLYVPLSPVCIFTEIYGSNPYVDREEVMKSCFGLLKACDEVFVMNSPYTKDSLGIREEINLASSLGIPVLWE